jgi:hypothetical protein
VKKCEAKYSNAKTVSLVIHHIKIQQKLHTLPTVNDTIDRSKPQASKAIQNGFTFIC